MNRIPASTVGAPALLQYGIHRFTGLTDMAIFRVITLLVLVAGVSAQAAELAGYKQTTLALYLTAAEANAMKQERGAAIVFIDVRTRAELAFVGMPVNADANIPFRRVDFETWNDEKKFFAMSPNPHFADSVAGLLRDLNRNKRTPILLMCRSGGRSAAAANLLAQQGYTQVYTVTDGFEGDKAKDGADKGRRVVNGWKNSGAPWTTTIDKNKLF